MSFARMTIQFKSVGTQIEVAQSIVFFENSAVLSELVSYSNALCMMLATSKGLLDEPYYEMLNIVPSINF